MDIQLNLPRGQRQQDFLDYLNAALRDRVSSYTGSVGINSDGDFESTLTGPFPIDHESVHLKWRIKKDTKGTLLSIGVEAADGEVSGNRWRAAAHEFTTSVLATAFSDARKTYFRRSFFYYVGPQLDGEYWLPGYRFAPAYPGDPEPHLVNAERVISIDQNVAAIDNMHASALADEASRRHAARLTLLLNTELYRAEPNQRWVWPLVEGIPTTESVRYQLGFQHPAANLSVMPKKNEQCPLGEYKGSLTARYRVIGELLSLPPEARRILRSVDNAAPLVTDAFDRGARLYQVAAVCGRYFPSVGLAYRVAAVEAVCQADRTCKGFGDFMRRYVASRSDLDQILNYLYGDIRSAHFHGGEFPMGEFRRQSFFDPLMDAEATQRDALHRLCHELTREAIVNWVIQLIPDAASTNPNELGD